MTVVLSVVPSDLEVVPVSNAAQTEPQVGGARQRKVRLGSHFMVKGKFPPLNMDDGRAHAADLLDCELDWAGLVLPQPDLVIGTPGTTRVNGAGQAGFLLVMDGATPGYVFKKGQLFNVVAGRRSLHSIQAQVTANGSGQATLRIWPMLPAVVADNTELDFVTPHIVGWLEINTGWGVTSDFTVETSFTIEEP
jgi:hypothetical protein